MITPLVQELIAIGMVLAEHSHGRIRIVRHEEDDSLAHQPEAQEFLKLDGHRLGRDFRLYEFMAEVLGTAGALADFALVLSVIKKQVPGAFDMARPTILDLERHFEARHRTAWKDLWE